MHDILGPLDSPTESPEDDWTMADQFLHGLLPDYNYQKSDNQWETMSLRAQAMLKTRVFAIQ